MLENFLYLGKFFGTCIFRMLHETKYFLITKCSMNFRSPIDNENADLVMPAWIAGIQVRRDASGNIRVNLDSSTPCWNDAIEGPLA